MRAAAAAILLALLAAPAADARPATLFAHLAGPAEEFVLNTQEPDAAFTLDELPGTLATTDTCLPANPVLGTDDYHTQLGMPTPGVVTYGKDGVRLPPVRGFDADVPILSSPAMLHWYWSADGADPNGTAAAPVPDVVVRATLQLGDAIHDADDDPGPVVASGESEPALLAGPSSQGVEHDEVGGRTVYHFVVPMDVDPEAATLPRPAGFTLRVETSVRNDACGDGRLMPGAVRLHSSPGHRPRLELDAGEPLALGVPLYPELVTSAGKPVITSLVLHAKVVDAWGFADLTRLEAWAEGPGLPRTAMDRAPVLQPDAHRIREEGLVAFAIADRQFAAGAYDFTLAAGTRQGANATWQASASLSEGPEAPGPTSAMVALLVVALGWARRMRRER